MGDQESYIRIGHNISGGHNCLFSCRHISEYISGDLQPRDPVLKKNKLQGAAYFHDPATKQLKLCFLLKKKTQESLLVVAVANDIHMCGRQRTLVPGQVIRTVGPSGVGVRQRLNLHIQFLPVREILESKMHT